MKNEVLDTVKEERNILQTIKWKPTGSGKSCVVTAFWNTLYKEKWKGREGKNEDFKLGHPVVFCSLINLI